jgi:hypothetical protein
MDAAAREYPAHLAVRPDDAELVGERAGVLPIAAHGGIGNGTIVRVQHAHPGAVQIVPARRQTQDAIHFRRPADRAADKVPIPGADAGGFLRQHQVLLVGPPRPFGFATGFVRDARCRCAILPFPQRRSLAVVQWCPDKMPCDTTIAVAAPARERRVWAGLVVAAASGHIYMRSSHRVLNAILAYKGNSS